MNKRWEILEVQSSGGCKLLSQWWYDFCKFANASSSYR